MKIDKIPDDAVLIPGTKDEYIDRLGRVYGYDRRAGHKKEPFLREQSTIHGYKYTKIRGVSTRVHRVVAEVFIPNPNNFPIVMHKNNNKADNRVENLQWGTAKENTQQAVNDHLLSNVKGADDSQSIPCDMYDTVTNKLIKAFGSVKEAARETGIAQGTISTQMRIITQALRKAVYFTRKGEGSRPHTIVVARDIKTGKELGRYPNVGSASSATGIPVNTIAAQCHGKRIWSKTDVIFSLVFLKGEEIIESDK